MPDLPSILIILAILLGIVLLRRARRNRAGGSESRRIDVEGDLLRACRGDRALVERLVAHELAQNAELSRTGAALMALAKLRDDQR